MIARRAIGAVAVSQIGSFSIPGCMPLPYPTGIVGQMPGTETHYAANEMETRAVGGKLAHRLTIGDVVLLDGPLGVGKTTLVRGVLEELGYDKPVRSPTFNLIQAFDTNPP